ncbi:MAG: FkbM family methyltransferase [Ferruginibacter sp.]
MSFYGSCRNITRAISKHPLAGKHPFKAYSRFLKWQISQLLFPGIRKVSFIENTSLLVKKGMTGATGNIYCGLHEFEEMGFLLHFLREEDTFIDVGANIGSYTVLASGLCRARSVSFEPVPSTFFHLEENIRINNIGHLATLWNAGAGAKTGKLKFTSGLDTVNHVLSENEQSENFLEVIIYPIDEIIGESAGVRLIKIDAEGFETEVLRGMSEMLKNEELRAIIIELNNSGERYGFHDGDIHEKLLGHDFKPYSYEPFTRRLTLQSSFNDVNTIYLRDADFVIQRLHSAKKRTIFSETF